jgi:hypothetical protein
MSVFLLHPPPLVDAFAATPGVEAVGREGLELESLTAYDNTVAAIQEGLGTLRRNGFAPSM